MVYFKIYVVALLCLFAYNTFAEKNIAKNRVKDSLLIELGKCGEDDFSCKKKISELLYKLETENQNSEEKLDDSPSKNSDKYKSVDIFQLRANQLIITDKIKYNKNIADSLIGVLTELNIGDSPFHQTMDDGFEFNPDQDYRIEQGSNNIQQEQEKDELVKKLDSLNIEIKKLQNILHVNQKVIQLQLKGSDK